MNTDINIVDGAPIDPSVPFCVRTYFKGLREAGAKPLAACPDNLECFLFCHYCGGEVNGPAKPWYAWADNQDPDKKQIRAYLSVLWAKHQHLRRQGYCVTLQLGICDDEIEPEVVPGLFCSQPGLAA
jgi:hypothetical protein